MVIDLRWKNGVCGIPYGEWSDDRGVRHQWIDLRQQPERIDELPEPRLWPELRAALLSINAPDSTFRTLGCEAWGPIAGTYRNGLTQRIGTYVQVAFAEPRVAIAERNYYTLAVLFFHFCKSRDKAEPLMVDIEFEQYAIFDQGIQGHCVTWSITGYGADGDSARKTMSTGLSLVADYLRQGR